MTSKRGYLTILELEQFADIEVIDDDEAYDKISQAEEMIDDYVGFQEKSYKNKLQGKISEVPSSTTFKLDTIHLNSFPYTNFFKGLHVEIVGGTGAGQQRKIASSTSLGVLTVESAFTDSPDTTSIYLIYQIGKFPRHKDLFTNNNENPIGYHRNIPEDVKRATAAQLQYMIVMGDAFFASNGEETSEQIGDYSVTRKAGGGGEAALIAPKAKLLLQGIRNRTGVLVA